jgi:hypothetical protein
MTLGCGSWGGNVTSDNVSPIHLMDIKRVAFETKPVGQSKTSDKQPVKINNGQQSTNGERQAPKRQEIAAIVDKFLRQKVAETAQNEVAKETVLTSVENPKPEFQSAASPVKTIIHELKTESTSNGSKSKAVDFVSEDDVRRAIESGEKIYVTPKTIITPSARDLGDEREIFARISK